MKNLTYYWFAALAYLRGYLYNKVVDPGRPTCTTGLNGKGEARAMYVRHNWIPWRYRRVLEGAHGISRTFITEYIEDSNE